MSRHAKKRRYMERPLSSLAENTRTSELISSRVVSTVSRQSTALFGDIAARDNTIDSDDASEQSSPVSPCLLPVVNFTKSPHEKYGNESPTSPCILPVRAPSPAGKKVGEEDDCRDEDAKCERKYVDVDTKKLLHRYNKLRARCRRLEKRVEFNRHRVCRYQDLLYDIRELATSDPDSPISH